MSADERPRSTPTPDVNNRRDRVDTPQVYPTWRDYAFSDSPEHADAPED